MTYFKREDLLEWLNKNLTAIEIKLLSKITALKSHRLGKDDYVVRDEVTAMLTDDARRLLESEVITFLTMPTETKTLYERVAEEGKSYEGPVDLVHQNSALDHILMAHAHLFEEYEGRNIEGVLTTLGSLIEKMHAQGATTKHKLVKSA